LALGGRRALGESLPEGVPPTPDRAGGGGTILVLLGAGVRPGPRSRLGQIARAATPTRLRERPCSRMTGLVGRPGKHHPAGRNIQPGRVVW